MTYCRPYVPVTSEWRQIVIPIALHGCTIAAASSVAKAAAGSNCSSSDSGGGSADAWISSRQVAVSRQRFVLRLAALQWQVTSARRSVRLCACLDRGTLTS